MAENDKQNRRQSPDEHQAELARLRQRVAGLEETLQERARLESDLDLTFRLSPMLMCVAGLDGYLRRFNRVCQETFGYSPQELRTRPYLEFMHPDDQAAFIAHVDQLSRGEPVLNVETRVMRPDATVRLIRWMGIPATEAGTVLCVGQDITEHSQTERALAEREQQLLEAQQVASLGFYVFEMATERFSVSPILCEIFGIPADYEKSIARWSELIHPDDRSGVLERFAEVTRENTSFDCEYRIFRYDDGALRWVHGLGRSQRGPDGRAVSVLGTVQDITDRKQAEIALQQAHDELERRVAERTAEVVAANKELELLRLFANAANQGFGVASMDGFVKYLNPAMCRLLGEQRCEDVIGQHIFAHGRSPEYMREVFLPTLLREGRWENEGLVRTRDGALVPIWHSSFVLHDDAGQPAYMATVMTDITERKRAEEALRQSERKFRNYFEQSLIGMAATTPDGRWLEVNERLCQILGYPQAELLQKNWRELTHPDDLVSDVEQYHRLRDGAIEHYTVDKRFIRKDGSIVYTTINIRAIRRDDGSIDQIFGLMEDTTARTLAEMALRQSEERYRAVVEDQTEIICRFRSDSTYLFVNDVFCWFFGRSREELLGRRWLAEAVAEDVPMIEAQLQQLSPSNPVVVVENRVYSGQRQLHWMQFVNRGFFDSAGRLTEIQSVGRDITARKQTQEALERERQSLWQMLQASDHERQLISYDIHDGLAQYLAAAVMQFQAYEALRETSSAEAVTAFRTATELVRQAHAESRRLVSEVRPPVIDENGIEMAIAHLVHDQRRPGGPKVKYDSDVQFRRLPAIVENALYRIAQEALTNACKHSQSRDVKVAFSQKGPDVWLEIEDGGIGFDPLAVAKGHFGLEGIRQRVRLLGGRLSIESRPGQGTRIQVVVPVVEEQLEA